MNYIKLSRKLMDWEWYGNINTCRLFVHMLLKANWKEGKFEGKVIPRGSFVSSIGNLANETNLTNDEIRTAIKHLISTNEITKQSYSKYTVFSVTNYSEYQDIPKQNPNQVPSSSQAIPKLFPTIEEKKEREEGKKDIYTVSNDTVCQTDVRRVVDEWNSLSKFGIKGISKLSNSSKRYQSLAARIREYGVEDVLKAIENIRHSDFLQGKVDGKRQWMITFDWFVLPNNFPKVLEGQYDNKEKGVNSYDSESGVSVRLW
jgi:hypothetical protein